MGDIEQVLEKKTKGFYNRWIERYYVWNESERKLSYWKNKAMREKDRNAPKSSYKADEFLSVVQEPSGAITVTLKGDSFSIKGENIQKFFDAFKRNLKPEVKAIESDERTADWSIEEIVHMMHEGQIMNAYFQNNTKKPFTLICRDLILYACPVNQGVDKAIIQLPLRRISDIYVGKQTPGFDTEVAMNVAFERCFTIISRKYTLDVETRSAQMAAHWLTGIKHLLTQSGKAVLVNEQEATTKPSEETEVTSTPSDASDEPPSTTSSESTATTEASVEPSSVGVEPSTSEPEVKPQKTALIIIDVQYDFCPPDGSLKVEDGLAVIPVINNLRQRVAWSTIAISQDWHPEKHVSFFINHKDNPKAKLFEELDLGDGRMQRMWPAHCIQHTKGSEFHHDLKVEPTDKVVKKGTNVDIDSYSAFYDNDHKTKTDLADHLKSHGITDVVLTGLAFDYCVGFSAIDARNEGFKVYVVEDATRGVAKESSAQMRARLREAGALLISSDQIPDSGLIPDNVEGKDYLDDDNEVPFVQGTAQMVAEDFIREDFLPPEPTPMSDTDETHHEDDTTALGDGSSSSDNKEATSAVSSEPAKDDASPTTAAAPETASSSSSSSSSSSTASSTVSPATATVAVTATATTSTTASPQKKPVTTTTQAKRPAPTAARGTGRPTGPAARGGRTDAKSTTKSPVNFHTATKPVRGGTAARGRGAATAARGGAAPRAGARAATTRTTTTTASTVRRTPSTARTPTTRTPSTARTSTTRTPSTARSPSTTRTSVTRTPSTARSPSTTRSPSITRTPSRPARTPAATATKPAGSGAATTSATSTTAAPSTPQTGTQ